MSGTVNLLMAIHCHQPVGNFGFVFEQAYAKAYDPFLQALERHPRVRLALHYSGCLLDWLIEERPEFLERVRALVERGQIELLASGYAEPILPIIPEADRQGQIAKMRAMLRAHGQTDPAGLWLTERVWEPELPQTLARAGIRYTMVDTNQFALARPWLPSALQIQDDEFWDLLGGYVTTYNDASVTVFPASKRLRYWLPFQPVDRTIEFLKRLRREEAVAITFADDGEKFGFWPGTYRWVYEEGWLDQWFDALERSQDWLKTTTFHDYLEQHSPNGRVALPGGSYEEMLEWSGGQFRNFFIKYPEANAMHQKMLHISRALQMLKAQGSRLKATTRVPRASSLEPRANGRVNKLLARAETELYLGQCNCAYWHGVFGGLYLSHLRRAIYSHLLCAEQLVGQARGSAASVTALDTDGDGCEELSLKTPTLGIVVDPEEGGTVTEWSLYAPRINLLDTLSRRHEPYHEKLKANTQQAAVAAGASPASIHDMLGVKEEHLEAHLIYDDHRRSAFIDYALQRMPTVQEVVRSTWAEQRLWSAGAFHLAHPIGNSRVARSSGVPRQRAAAPLEVTMTRKLAGGRVVKALRVPRDEAVVEYRYHVEGLTIPVVGIEFNLALRDERYLGQAQEYARLKTFEVEEPSLGVSLRLTLDTPARVIHFPVETVSESEQGLERTYQALCIVCLWALDGATSWQARMRWSVVN